MGGELTTGRERWLPSKAVTGPAWQIALAQRMRRLTFAQQADAIAAALALVVETHGDELTPKQWENFNHARALVVDAMLAGKPRAAREDSR